MYTEALRTKLAPYTQERLTKDLQKLGDKLREHLSDAGAQMQKYRLELQAMMEQNIDDVSVKFSTYSRKLRKRLGKDTQEIKR